MPINGVSVDVIFFMNAGKYPTSLPALNTLAMVNCQPSREPKQERSMRPMIMRPTVGPNM